MFLDKKSKQKTMRPTYGTGHSQRQRVRAHDDMTTMFSCLYQASTDQSMSTP